MHKNAQKVEWKSQSKISCHYTWLLHSKNWPPRWRFLRSFLPQASRVEDQSLQQKEKKRGKRKGGKKSKIESKDVGHLLVQKTQNFDFCARPRQNVVKRDASGKKRKLSSCKCIFVDQIKANLAEIQPQNQQNLQKTHFWRKAQGSRPSFIHHTKHKEVLVS